ncbi:hypothetical protein PL11201_680204 [Planktothrix sp. PCC 11201]|nr:hypothetical protein PL11201_680204 [Planktothrix sp. PCC 11201]
MKLEHCGDYLLIYNVEITYNPFQGLKPMQYRSELRCDFFWLKSPIIPFRD